MISREIIKQLAAEELVSANEQHGQTFNSPHEAYAVLMEEVEEVIDEFSEVGRCLKDFWICVKEDANGSAELDTLKRNAISCVQEMIQVVAMCDKALKLYE